MSGLRSSVVSFGSIWRVRGVFDHVVWCKVINSIKFLVWIFHSDIMVKGKYVVKELTDNVLDAEKENSKWIFLLQKKTKQNLQNSITPNYVLDLSHSAYKY